MRRLVVLAGCWIALVGCGGEDAATPRDRPVGGTRTSAVTAPALPEVTVRDQDNHGRVRLQEGQVLAVELAANPSTGYSWKVVWLERNVLRPDGEPTYRADPVPQGVVGSGGTATLRFRAVAKGPSRLLLDYQRPWETKAPLMPSYTLDVMVL